MAKDVPVKENQDKNTAADVSVKNKEAALVVSAPESDMANVESVDNEVATEGAKKVVPVKVAKAQSNKSVPQKNTVSKEKPISEAQKPTFRAQADSSNPKASKTVKKGKDGKPRKNIFKRMFNGIKSIISELKKVTWPKGKTVASNTLIVLVFVIVFLIVIFIFDYVLTGLLSLLMGNGWVSLFG